MRMHFGSGNNAYRFCQALRSIGRESARVAQKGHGIQPVISTSFAPGFTFSLIIPHVG
jgi:hypothetical protein